MSQWNWSHWFYAETSHSTLQNPRASTMCKDRTLAWGYGGGPTRPQLVTGGTEIAAFTGKYRVKGIILCVVQAADFFRCRSPIANNVELRCTLPPLQVHPTLLEERFSKRKKKQNGMRGNGGRGQKNWYSMWSQRSIPSPFTVELRYTFSLSFGACSSFPWTTTRW